MNKEAIRRSVMTLTYLRIVLTLLMYPLAYYEYRFAFLGTFIAACGTDFLDGLLARRYHVTTEQGAKWDTIADQVLLVSLAPFVYWLAPHVDYWYYQWPIYVGIWILLNNVACKFKFGRLANFHLWSAKAGTASLLLFALWLIAFGFNEVLYWLATLSIAIAALEVSLILLFKKTLKTNVKSFFSL